MSFVLVLLLLCVGAAAPPSDPTKERVSIRYPESVPGGGYSTEELQKTLSRWRQAPLYDKLSASDFLLEHLLKEGNGRGIPSYRWQSGTHDLHRVAGRAAWALEELLGIKLPKVGPTTTAAELHKIHLDAARALEQHRQQAAKEATLTDRPLKDLKADYRGKLKIGIIEGDKVVFKRADMMFKLLGEWYPLGKKPEQLAEILGHAGTRTTWREENVVEYRIENGWNGLGFTFVLRDGVIRAVVVFAIY